MVTARAVDHAFDYQAQAGVKRGALVEVELGARTVRGSGDGGARRGRRGLKPVLGVTGSVPEPLLALAEWIAATYASTLSRAVGLVIPPPAGVRAPDPWVRLVSLEGATRRQAEVLAHVGLAPLPLSDLVAAAGTTRDTVRRMAQRGLVALDPAPRAAADDVRVTLTPEQELAVAACAEALAAGGGDVLVHGVTGSARPRSTCARSTPPSTRVAAPSCSCPRSRSRPRRPPASSPASATPWRSCTAASRRAARLRARPHRRRRGAGGGGGALGGLRGRARPGRDRRRRGARRLLQARGRPALRRPPGRGQARAAAGRGRRLRKRHPAAGVLVRDPAAGQPLDPGGGAAAPGRHRRPARRRRLPADPAADRRAGAHRRQRRPRDPAPEPARGGLGDPLPHVRPHVALRPLRRLARPFTAAAWSATTAAPPSRCRGHARRAGRSTWPTWARARPASRTSSGAASPGWR